MKIRKNAYVSVTYEMRTTSADAEVEERATEERPLGFVFGAGRMLPSFEQHLEGLNVGDGFSFSLSPAEAYGEREQEAVVPVPKNIFVMDGVLREDLLQLGTRVPMFDNQGRRMVGMVLEVKDNEVVMDFNHPLAGETMFFTGKVIEVREATAEEIVGPQHGCGGCGGGGCHGGGCHGDDGEGCGGGCGSCGGECE
ncbi:MAG: FKBP-type peptidyl-prolyl cis-trans isomerase [Bacteroidales bacterium]|nr:FKBP-type peptidyl-prolyl cis-trans isomerase [Bacteroidales bacterium]